MSSRGLKGRNPPVGIAFFIFPTGGISKFWGRNSRFSMNPPRSTIHTGNCTNIAVSCVCILDYNCTHSSYSTLETSLQVCTVLVSTLYLTGTITFRFCGVVRISENPVGKSVVFLIFFFFFLKPFCSSRPAPTFVKPRQGCQGRSEARQRLYLKKAWRPRTGLPDPGSVRFQMHQTRNVRAGNELTQRFGFLKQCHGAAA